MTQIEFPEGKSGGSAIAPVKIKRSAMRRYIDPEIIFLVAPHERWLRLIDKSKLAFPSFREDHQRGLKLALTSGVPHSSLSLSLSPNRTQQLTIRTIHPIDAAVTGTS
jgi:hypothetical protein